MERKTSVVEARNLFGSNFIGIDELSAISDKIGVSLPLSVPEIPFNIRYLEERKNDYFLILGSSISNKGKPLSLLFFRNHFGFNPENSEPCFYNQDWYLNESFASECSIEEKWYLIRKNLLNESRGKNIDQSDVQMNWLLPSSLVCVYCFFTYYFHTKSVLWPHDYLWCSDHDSNGDRIYAGRYYDISGLSKNGFSIHRHLRIKENYGCIDIQYT
jgi:hypothetical protein